MKGHIFVKLLLGEEGIKAIEKAGLTINYDVADKLVEVLSTSMLSKLDMSAIVERIVE